MIGGDCMSDVSTSTRRFAEKSAAQTKNAFNKGGAAIEEGTRRLEQNASSAVNGMRECYLKVLDMEQENADAGFDLARELASVQTPSEYVEVWSAWARSAYGTFSEQTRELSGLAQKVATSSAQPLTNGLMTPFRRAS
jgi:phasin